MAKKVKANNYYQLLQHFPDSYLSNVTNSIYGSYVVLEDDNIVIFYDSIRKELYIESLNLKENDQLYKLVNFAFKNKIYFKKLNDMSESYLFSENYNEQTDYSESFFLIKNMILIYYESINNSWHSEDLNSYDSDRKTDILGFFIDHNIQQLKQYNNNVEMKKQDYISENKFYARINDNLLIVNEPNWGFFYTKKPSGIDISTRLISQFNKKNMLSKTLYEFSDSILFNKQPSNHENFYTIIGYEKTLIYVESTAGNWYKKDFSLYDNEQIQRLICSLKDNGVYEMDLFYYCAFVNNESEVTECVELCGL